MGDDTQSQTKCSFSDKFSEGGIREKNDLRTPVCAELPLPHPPTHSAQGELREHMVVSRARGNLLKIFCGGGGVPEEIWPKKAPCGTHLLETVEWVEKRQGNEAEISLKGSYPGKTQKKQRACDIC